MNKEEFIDLVWRLEEILMHVDHLRSEIGNCPEKCDGLDAEDYEVCVLIVVMYLQWFLLKRRNLQETGNIMRSCRS